LCVFVDLTRWGHPPPYN